MDMEQAKADIMTVINTALGDRDLECPACMGHVWTPPDIFMNQQVEFDPGPVLTVRSTGNIAPTATLCCDRCGYSMSFNLIKLGVWARWNQNSIVIPQGMGGNGHYLEVPGKPTLTP